MPCSLQADGSCADITQSMPLGKAQLIEFDGSAWSENNSSQASPLESPFQSAHDRVKDMMMEVFRWLRSGHSTGGDQFPWERGHLSIFAGRKLLQSMVRKGSQERSVTVSASINDGQTYLQARQTPILEMKSRNQQLAPSGTLESRQPKDDERSFRP
ncbi:hypothetical protein VTL71DRAFT_12253 [Oculimacula yallundae]|uniref:Uncharacterized protein n=1 Tax=Oculimacula yallundae TaxID=86028 RepID=A0ABR4CSS4_9HELO